MFEQQLHFIKSKISIANQKANNTASQSLETYRGIRRFQADIIGSARLNSQDLNKFEQNLLILCSRSLTIVAIPGLIGTFTGYHLKSIGVFLTGGRKLPLNSLPETVPIPSLETTDLIINNTSTDSV